MSWNLHVTCHRYIVTMQGSSTKGADPKATHNVQAERVPNLISSKLVSIEAHRLLP